MIPSKRILNWLIIGFVLIIMALSVAPTNSIKQVNLGSTLVLSIRSDYLLHVLLFLPWMVLISWRWKDIGKF
jgi:uncharacterized membrane protein YhaH (DUF805 family)